MNTPIKKIDIEKNIRYWNKEGRPEIPIIILAEKINELVDFCNNKTITLNICKHEYDDKDMATCTKCDQVRALNVHFIN